MTDGNRKVLSLVTLKQLLPAAIRPGYEPKLKLALAASRFAHDLRHADIGHRNREVALKVKPCLAPGSEAAEALRGLVDAIVLVPAAGGLRIELWGNLAAMLSEAQNAKRSPEGDLSLQIAMVAGARNQHYLQLWRPAA
jgi:hypothetical protein